jgi:hypothetical protein
MTRINIMDSISTSHIEDMEDDVVDDVDDDVDMSGNVANDMAADVVMTWIEGMMCMFTWSMMWLLVWQ